MKQILLRIKLASILSVIAPVLFFVVIAPDPAYAQLRGQYTPGMSATNSGSLPTPGISYVNIFQLYSYDQLKGIKGNSLPVNGELSVMIDQNVFMWVSKTKILGGSFAFLADLPVANSSLTSATLGALAGGSGLADSYYQPFTLGWQLSWADLQVAYGFTAPTGKFNVGQSNNVGSGYWGNDIVAAQTIYLTKNKGTAVSAYEQYEFHGTQKDTDIHPGQTFDIDYSITQILPLQKNMKTLLQVGLVGYGQYQTTDRSGPGINPVVAANSHYKVNAIGFAANIIQPEKNFAIGVKYFKEYSNSSTIQGSSLQISGAITF